ncbi:hypothetical protein Ahy_A06g029050 [Arachis hypogaea]|uniref:Aminotransferase-like plant mobile domain-containing protein n=2 Tax=Arachis hypogaea TaxID=3818 RepID=A0A445CS52_ARAHY|nr:hypothetical protein Ahy_A06g029050 [Arachis hypogaea]
MGDDPARLYRLDGVAHIAGVINDEELLGVIPPPSQVQKFAVNCSWFQETFGECPEGADEETVRRFTRAYIMMLLGTQLFADKSGNRIHIRWLPYVARLEEMGSYSLGLLGMIRAVGLWHRGYSPSYSKKGPRVQSTRLKIDMLQPRDFIWMPYSSPEVLQVVHPEALEPRHMAVWRSVTSLIYFAVVQWHQVDGVLPQFGGVQPLPRPALNTDFLMSKDGRGGDRWFPSALQHWHILWEIRADHVLWFNVVADPGPSHTYLDWWSQHEKRFLSPEFYLGDPRGVPIHVEESQRGPGRVPDMDRVDDVLDRRWVERRARVGTRRSQREWRWLEQAMGEADEAGRGGGRGRGRGGRRRALVAGHDNGDLRDVDGGGRGAVGVVSPHHGGLGGEGYATGDPTSHGEAGLGEGPLGDYFVGVPPDDHTLQESTPWVSPGSTFLDFCAGVGYDGDFGGSPFLDEISAIMHDDEAVRGRSQTTGTQAPLHVDLNEPPSVPPPKYFALGDTPVSAHTTGSHSVVGPSSSRPVHVQSRTPAQPAPQDEDEDDEIEDEEPLIRRGQRTRVPRRCFTGSHLFR